MQKQREEEKQMILAKHPSKSRKSPSMNIPVPLSNEGTSDKDLEVLKSIVEARNRHMIQFLETFSLNEAWLHEEERTNIQRHQSALENLSYEIRKIDNSNTAVISVVKLLDESIGACQIQLQAAAMEIGRLRKDTQSAFENVQQEIDKYKEDLVLRITQKYEAQFGELTKVMESWNAEINHMKNIILSAPNEDCINRMQDDICRINNTIAAINNSKMCKQVTKIVHDGHSTSSDNSDIYSKINEMKRELDDIKSRYQEEEEEVIIEPKINKIRTILRINKERFNNLEENNPLKNLVNGKEVEYYSHHISIYGIPREVILELRQNGALKEIEVPAEIVDAIIEEKEKERNKARLQRKRRSTNTKRKQKEHSIVKIYNTKNGYSRVHGKYVRIIRCYTCNKIGHKAYQCRMSQPKRINSSNNYERGN
eukprot:TRINITY_DN11275_c0_g2_i1.p1 TRINITY_DN11275_c0_g2~~TRINITY_DN11275_c0_g2_i1.p1  ORF type:complete len:448 (-),score=45.85 TRINITY_DN11275_c0_g2_i1:223-1497(-)